MSTSETLEKKLTGLLLGLKLETKTVTDVLPILNRLKATGSAIYEDYEKKYKEILAKRKESFPIAA